MSLDRVIFGMRHPCVHVLSELFRMTMAMSLGGCAFTGSGAVVIIMEYLNFGARSDQAELGRRLAQMHLATPAVWHRSTMTDASFYRGGSPGMAWGMRQQRGAAETTVEWTVAITAWVRIRVVRLICIKVRFSPVGTQAYSVMPPPRSSEHRR